MFPFWSRLEQAVAEPEPATLSRKLRNQRHDEKDSLAEGDNFLLRLPRALAEAEPLHVRVFEQRVLSAEGADLPSDVRPGIREFQI